MKWPNVHDEKGKTVLKDKYIGDVIESNGSNEEKVKERINKGHGIANEIICILKEVPFGSYKTVVGMK